MRDINAFWFGPRLGPVHAACLRSFLKFGYRVRLHVYETPEDLPAGVETFDAEKLMPRAEVTPHRKTGSYAFASDKYRIRILEAGMGIYVDADVYCLKPFPEDDYLIGWETDRRVNGAVLAAPADSDFVRLMMAALTAKAFIPPWEKERRRLKLRLMKAIGLSIDASRLPWGSFGPSLATHVVQEAGIADKVLPIDAFYPLHHHQMALLRDPGLSVDDIVTRRTYGLHLYNNLLNADDIPEESPLGAMIAGRV